MTTPEAVPNPGQAVAVAAGAFALGAAVTVGFVMIVDAVVRRARAAVEAATIDMDDWHVTGWGR